MFAVTAVVAIVMLALTGCGSTDDESTEPGGTASTTAPTTVAVPISGVSACPLTTEQVSATVGHDLVPLGDCSWEAADLAAAVLEVYFSGTDQGHLDFAEGEEVQGVGDEARFDVSGALVFRIGERHFVMQVLNIGQASQTPSERAAVELAAVAAAALG